MDPWQHWAILGAIAFVPPLAFLFWVRARERHGREPVGPVLGIFVHGATLGVLLAIVLGLLLDLTVAAGSVRITAVIAAPLLEELTKGLGFGFVRRHVDEPEDGLVYGIAVGLGFAATETLIYGGMELLDNGAASAIGVVVVRHLSSLLLHAGSSALLGFGYAAMRLRHGAWPQLVPAYLLAVGLHALYNFLVLLEVWAAFVAAIVMVTAVMGALLRRLRQLDRRPLLPA